MKVGDLVKISQRASPSRSNSLPDLWVPICEGLLVDYFTDDDIDNGVASVLDSSGTIQRIDLTRYQMSQVNKKRMMFKAEVISG